MSFGCSVSDIVNACKVAANIYRTFQYQKDLEAANSQLYDVIEVNDDSVFSVQRTFIDRSEDH